MSRRIFVSFAHEDEHLAQRIVEQLKRDGLDVFYAPESLRVGENLAGIFDELFLREVFLVLLTPRSKGSRWVAKELGLALSHQAYGRPRLIIPVYRDLAEAHHWLADVKALQWSGDDDDKLGGAIRLVMQGDTPQRDGGFEAFVTMLVRLPRDAYDTLVTLSGLAVGGSEENDDGSEIRRRALTNIQTAMKKSHVALADQERVLQALQLGTPLPAVCADHAGEVRRWVRQAEPIHIRLTSHLWKMRSRYREGLMLSDFVVATEGWLTEEVPDKKLRRWRCEQLFKEAHTLGLLQPSREHAAEVVHLNERLNDPGAEWGPMLKIMAILVAAFEHEQRRLIDGN